MLASSAIVGSSPVAAQSPGKGAEIRAKIAANRARRLAIAEAMKREAGVTDHTVHKEDLSGLAYIGTGKILSPQGRKIVQLCTLAHECGHIFLHNAGSGYWLPSHVKELEAETYMHQALREHGMAVPRWRTRSGRDYIAWWIAQDRATNVPIDPRAEAYAAGQRPPFERLRMVPSTWRSFRAVGSSRIGAWLRRLPVRVLGYGVAEEARTVFRLAAGWALAGYMGFGVGCTLMYLVGGVGLSDLFPEVFPVDRSYLYGPQKLTGACCSLLLANLAVLCRTLVRR